MTPQLKKWLDEKGESLSSLKNDEKDAENLEKRINELREMSIMDLIDLFPHEKIAKLKEEYIEWIIVESWDL